MRNMLEYHRVLHKNIEKLSPPPLEHHRVLHKNLEKLSPPPKFLYKITCARNHTTVYAANAYP